MTAIVDTNFLVSLTNPNDRHHDICAAFARNLQEGLVVPYVVLPEATYLIHKYQGHHVMRQFVRRMRQPVWNFEPLQGGDLVRVFAILEKYPGLNLDFVDAAIVTVAERLNVRRVLTLDRRDFRVIRPSHCPFFELLPEIDS
ncbi:MAG: PIN domain-containing protein [Chloroflexi bacterium]|nr:PIN domain-containing protein [Chloroflexota bacterium]